MEDTSVNITKRALKWDYGGSDKVRGVSLGGWLVLEAFITPSLFDSFDCASCLDEWHIGKDVSKSKATKILTNHFNSFITEADFAKIASLGLNHIRIPVGFWAMGKLVGSEPYLVLNQYDKLKEAVSWALKYDLKVLLDLHGAPGSQNGFDHSGHFGSANWSKKQSRIDRTVDYVEMLAKEFSKSKYGNIVTGIGVLNEPFFNDKVEQFYKDSYEAVRRHSQDMLLVYSDAFRDPTSNDYWNNRLRPPTYEQVAFDSHFYTIFDNGGIAMKIDQRRDYYCSKRDKLANAQANYHYTLVGEFTPAFTDCAKYLNGFQKGARYDGTLPGSEGNDGNCKPKRGSGSKFSEGYKDNLAKMWESQVSAYESGTGWIHWTWKTEAGFAEDWSYSAGVENGWIPKNASKRPKGYAC